MSEHAVQSLKTTYVRYAGILGILAVFTVGMIFIGESSMTEAPKVALLLVGSATKASLIMFYFMHLRGEKSGLIWIVFVGIFVTSVLMFAVPAYDGGHVLQQSLFK